MFIGNSLITRIILEMCFKPCSMVVFSYTVIPVVFHIILC